MKKMQGKIPLLTSLEIREGFGEGREPLPELQGGLRRPPNRQPRPAGPPGTDGRSKKVWKNMILSVFSFLFPLDRFYKGYQPWQFPITLRI